MEIKPGKYRTRDSKMAVVLEVFEASAFGRYLSDDGNWYSCDWSILGKVYKDINVGSFSNCYGAIAICEKAPLGSWHPVPELDALFERSEG